MILLEGLISSPMKRRIFGVNPLSGQINHRVRSGALEQKLGPVEILSSFIEQAK
jgi:hypothetical protein